MRYFVVLLMCVLGYMSLDAQNQIKEIAVTGKIEDISFVKALPGMLDNDLIFYGFIHGTEMAQQTEAALLIELMKKGVHYYAPEVSRTGAYFLNRYFATGDEKYLIYVLQSYAAPQDASIQWIEKYRKLFEFNQTLNPKDRLTVIGTDGEYSKSLVVTYLADILSDYNTGIPIVDSLKYYKTLEKKVDVLSLKTVYKLSFKYHCSISDIVYPSSSQHCFANRFFKYYAQHKAQVLKVFKPYDKDVESILSLNNNDDRETIITQNFTHRVIPLLQQGKKVFSNFGYFHVLQASFKGYLPLAGRLKKNNPTLKIYSILTQLADCEVLSYRKYCKTKKIKKYGKTIQLATVCGSITADDLDGNTKKEQIRGINMLKEITPTGELAVVPIAKLPAEYINNRYFIDYEKHKNAGKVKLDAQKTTADYYQGLIYIEGSKANEPYELLKK